MNCPREALPDWSLSNGWEVTMYRSMSATDARVHFGEILRRIEEYGETIVVNRAGKPQAIIMSIEEFNRLKGRIEQPEWERRLEETHELIRQEGGGRLTTPIAEVVREMREERDEQILSSLH
jgi:prevent-host-death family protein